jgi:hypothetical protein
MDNIVSSRNDILPSHEYMTFTGDSHLTRTLLLNKDKVFGTSLCPEVFLLVYGLQWALFLQSNP